jgi:hypothetical protein
MTTGQMISRRLCADGWLDADKFLHDVAITRYFFG